jgi:hypothetical protein
VREDDPRLTVDALTGFSEAFLAALGCSAPVAAEVAAHLVEADLMGVYSHGTMRLPQYLDWVRKGMFDPAGEPRLTGGAARAPLVDGANGFGMPAMRVAVAEGASPSRRVSGAPARAALPPLAWSMWAIQAGWGPLPGRRRGPVAWRSSSAAAGGATGAR